MILKKKKSKINTSNDCDFTFFCIFKNTISISFNIQNNTTENVLTFAQAIFGLLIFSIHVKLSTGTVSLL